MVNETNAVVPAVVNSVKVEAEATVKALMEQYRNQLKVNRETCRNLGIALNTLSKQYVNGKDFHSWFTATYARSAQTAMLWMRLATQWDRCKLAYDALPTPKLPWDEFTINETLDLIRTKQENPKNGPTEPPVTIPFLGANGPAQPPVATTTVEPPKPPKTVKPRISKKEKELVLLIPEKMKGEAFSITYSYSPETGLTIE
jgi:hypothetical protein